MLLIAVNKIVSIAIILMQIFLVVGIVYFIKHRKDVDNKIINIASENGGIISAALVFGGIVLSLFYSEIAGYQACILCVVQRWLLYPQILIILIGMYYKKASAYMVAYALSFLGLIVALYHNYIDYGGGDFFACDALGAGISCTRRYVLEFGYVTIPMMSLTAFALIMFFLTLKTRKMCDNNSVTIQ